MMAYYIELAVGILAILGKIILIVMAFRLFKSLTEVAYWYVIETKLSVTKRLREINEESDAP